MSASPTVGIIGAGIGGTTLGLLLARAGIRVKVFEQAPAILPVGAGIVLVPNALCSLDRLGLLSSLRKVSSPITTTKIYKLDHSGRGRWIRDVSLAYAEAAVGYPTLSMARADLQFLLIDELRKQGGLLPPSSSSLSSSSSGEEILNLGKKLKEARHIDDHVQCVFEDGTEENVDLLIGADGLRSRVRQTALPITHQREPTWTKMCVTQGICTSLTQRHPSETAVWMFLHKKVYGSFPLKDGGIYWFVASREHEVPGPNWQSSEVTVRDQEFLRTAFFPDGVTGEDILNNSIRSLSIGVYDQPDQKDWHYGRAALIGDAAHPMSPAAGQGGNQAIIDATTMANLIYDFAGPQGIGLKDRDVVNKIFSSYQAVRKRGVSRIVREANLLGQLNTADSLIERIIRDMVWMYMPNGVYKHVSLNLFRNQIIPKFLPKQQL